MFKSLIIGTALSAAFLAGGRVHYSALQLQTPMGSAVKVTPDPSNIWSFHETYTFTATGKHSIPIVVDFDKNGKMDTELDQVRVSITDILISGSLQDVVLKDSKGVRWALYPAANQSQFRERFTTPLVLPVDSGLTVEFTVYSTTKPVHIHLIGRLVTL